MTIDRFAERVKEEADAFEYVNEIIEKGKTESRVKISDALENPVRCILAAAVLYLWHMTQPDQQGSSQIERILEQAGEVDENDPSAESPIDALFSELQKEDPENTAVKFYKALKRLSFHEYREAVFTAQYLMLMTIHANPGINVPKDMMAEKEDVHDTPFRAHKK